MLMTMAFTSFCQQNHVSQTISHDEYLKKSKNQKTGAWLLLGGGSALVVIGLVSTSTEDVANYVFGGDKTGFNTGLVLFYTGVLSGLGSIPLFIASARNKKKAMSISFKNETAPQIQKSSFVYRAVPSVSLKISL